MPSLVQQHWIFPGVCLGAAVVIPLIILSPSAPVPEPPLEAAPFNLDIPQGTPVGPAIMAMPFSNERDPTVKVGGADIAPMAESQSSPPMLTGLAGRMRGPRVALVRTTDGGTLLVRVGEEADGWKIEAIGQDSITVSRGSERQVATLDYNNSQNRSPVDLERAPRP